MLDFLEIAPDPALEARTLGTRETIGFVATVGADAFMSCS